MAPRNPKPTAIREPPALLRQPVTFLTPNQLQAGQWRQFVASAPVVRSCVQTQIMQITGLDWFIEGEDEKDKEYFTKVLDSGDDGEGFEVMLSRVVRDTLELPFGGAVEIGQFPDDVVAWLHHIDGATMVPTYSQEFPYAQADPFGSLRTPVSFRKHQIGRVRWQAQSDLRSYGWTIPPVQDCLPAIQGLLRADRFWQSFLLDTPPAGILEVPGFDENDATQWYQGWRTMLAGIDPFKVPILHGRGAGGGEKQAPARFIEFHKTPGETQMRELVKAYAEEVCACFGMTLGDLGLFGQELRLAGAMKMIDLSKRQGLAKLMRAVKSMIDMDVLPDGLEFKWAAIDVEDDLRKAQAKEITGRKIVNLVTGRVLSERQGLKVAIAEEVIPPDIVEEEGFLEEEEASEEHAEITDKEMGSEGQPTGENVEDELEQRADAPPRAFPANSKWARQMAKVAQRMMTPARRGLTKMRIGELLSLGLEAWGEEGRSLETRSAEEAKDALATALEKADWWKSPDLTDDVARVLSGAYEEGAAQSIAEIEAKRVALGLASVEVQGTTFNLSNKAVLGLLQERAGEFIGHIDDGTRKFVVDSIMRGVREGVSSPQIANRILVDHVIEDVLETFEGRTLSIVNTEINWAESRAALDEQRHLGLDKKRWVSIPGLHCEICASNSAAGSVDAKYEYQSVFGPTQSTPAHPGVCLVGDSRVAAQGVAAASERRYHGDLIILRTRAGNQLRCTPNHPILTDHGWLPARLLVKGNHVISSLRDEWVAVRNHHDNDVPPRIEKIAESFRCSAQVPPVEMKTAAEHFHGDGIGSEVAVIYPNSLLVDHREASLLQHLAKMTLCRRHADLFGLTGSRAPQFGFQGYLPTLAQARPLTSQDRGMGGGNLGLALLRRHALPLQELGFAAVSQMDATPDQRVTDGLPAYPIPCREAIDRLAGEVFLDELVEVDTLRNWDGHVYNLQTADGFYVANAIVTHNCHCYMTFDDDELKALGDAPSYWMGD